MHRTSRRPLALSLTLSLLVALAACGDDAPVTPDAGRIVTDPDLGGGPACVAPATPGEALAPCICGSDCAVGAACDPEESSLVPGGSCVRACTVDAECGANATCRVVTVGRCVPSCTAASDCGEGRFCGSGVCMPLCQADSQCRSGNCDRWTGRCLPPGEVSTGANTSEACLRDEDCRSLACSSAGRCLTFCSRSAQGCPDGEFCYGDDAYIDAGWCFPLCTVTADCADPAAACLDVTDLGRSARVCF